jgi:hypothetical protein
MSREERRKRRRDAKHALNMKRQWENFSQESQSIASKTELEFAHNGVKFKNLCKDKNVLILGNSNGMIAKPHREEIDSYDVVVRMSKGYLTPERYDSLGTKTTLWAFTKGHLRALANNSGEDFFRSDFFGFFYGRRIHDHLGNQRPARRIKDRLFVMETPKKRLENIARTNIPVPSTGLTVINFFMNEVKEAQSISLMGFDFFDCAPKHEGDRAKSFYAECGLHRNHDGQREKEYVGNLQEQGKLKILEF